MGYREELRKRISKWTGLRGIEVDNVLNALQERNVDPYTIDWKTLGEEIKDFGDRYQATWDWLGRMYGISKPVYIGLKIDREEEIYREGEQLLYSGVDGVRELLNRIYSGEIPVEEERIYRDIILGGGLPYITDLALYNGSERELAKKFLIEEVIKKPVVLEEKVEEVEEEKKEETEEETEELLMKKIEEELFNAIMEKMRKADKVREEIKDKLRAYESRYIVFDIDVDVDGNITVTAKPRPGYEEAFMGVKGSLFKVEGNIENYKELEHKLLSNLQKLSEQVYAMKTFSGKPIIPTITGGEEVKIQPIEEEGGARMYQCLTCGYIASGSRARELNYICPKCGDRLYPVE